MILIDVYTREGVIGRSYLEPYLKDALGSIIALHCNARRVRRSASQLRRSTSSNPIAGRETSSDMKVITMIVHIRHGDLGRTGEGGRTAADAPACGTVGPVPAYNSNGLRLSDVSTLANEAADLIAARRLHGAKTSASSRRNSRRFAAIREVRQAAGASSNSWSTGTFTAMHCSDARRTGLVLLAELATGGTE